MKKLASIVLIIIMFSSQALAQFCGIEASYDLNVNTYTPSIISYALAGNPGAVTDSSTTGTGLTFSTSAVDWYAGCFNNEGSASFFDDFFNKYTESFYLNDYDVWIDTCMKDDSVVHLYSDDDTFVLVLTDSDGLVQSSRRFDYTSNLEAKAVALSDDGYIFVVGDTSRYGFVGIYTPNGASFTTVSEQRIGPRYYTNLFDVEYDDDSGNAIIVGNTEEVEAMAEFILMTVDVTGTINDLDYITDDDPNDMGGIAKIDIYPREEENTRVFFAGMTNEYPGNILQGGFDISPAGLISTSHLQLLAIDDDFVEYEWVYDLKTDESTGDWYLTFNALDESNYQLGGICRIGPNGGVQTCKVIDEDQTVPSGRITIADDNQALFTTYNLITQLDSSDNSFSLWQATADDSIYLNPIEYFESSEEYLALGYTSSVSGYPYMAILDYATKAVVSSQELSTTEGEITNTAKAIVWREDNPNDLILELVTNNGGGFQDFGITSPIDGPVPEFSITTLLLAVLLAGGLVLFVVRGRK